MKKHLGSIIFAAGALVVILAFAAGWNDAARAGEGYGGGGHCAWIMPCG